jgi:hypothetical protein
MQGISFFVVTALLVLASSCGSAKKGIGHPLSGTVQGDCTVSSAGDAAMITKVTAITGDFVVTAPDLSSLSLAQLATIGGHLSIYGTTSIAAISLPTLTTCGGLSINGDAALTDLSLPALTTVNGWLTVQQNTALKSLSLAALATSGWLTIFDNAALTKLSLPALKTVSGDFYVIDNAQLPTCQADNLFSQLVGFTGSKDLGGNGVGTCP